MRLKKKTFAPWKEGYDGPTWHIRKQRLLCQQRSVLSKLWLHMDVRVGPERRLNTEELMLLSCGDGEDSWESLGLQYQTSQS